MSSTHCLGSRFLIHGKKKTTYNDNGGGWIVAIFKIPITSHSCHFSHAHGDTLDRRLHGGRRSSPETDTGKARKVLWLYANITCCHLTLYGSWITQVSIVKSLLHPPCQPPLQSFWVCLRIHVLLVVTKPADDCCKLLLKGPKGRQKRKTVYRGFFWTF